MGETIENSIEEDESITIGDRDKAILQVYVTFISSVCVTYAIAFNDVYIAVLGIYSLIMTYLALKQSSKEFITPMKNFVNPIEESMLALLFYFTFAWLISSIVAGSGLLIEVGLLLLVGVIPILLILSKGCNYSFRSIGFIRTSPKNAKQFYWIVVIGLLLGFISRVLTNLGNLSNLFTSNGISQALYYIVFAGISIGFAEELVFRGIMQPRISQFYRSKIMGLLVTSSVFAALHFLSISVFSFGLFDPVNALFYALLTRLTLGIVFGFLWIFSENIVLPWSIHALNNSIYGILLVMGVF